MFGYNTSSILGMQKTKKVRIAILNFDSYIVSISPGINSRHWGQLNDFKCETPSNDFSIWNIWLLR